jgi:hypothetical protein
MDLIHKNYLRGYGNGATWNVEIDAPSRPVKSYYEETVISADMIWSQKQGKLHLLYSGGLDSEYVLSVFLKLGMEIQPVIMKLRSDTGEIYNIHELNYAFEYCNQKNLSPTIVDLNFDEFVRSGKFLQISESVKCAAYQLPASMWLASQIDGTVITGNDPPHMKLNADDNLWYLDEEEIIHSQFNYFKNYGVYGTPFFLSYTPEMMLSFLLDPTMEALANHAYPGKLGTNSTKVNVFNRYSDLNLVQRVKQTGYEQIEKSPIFNHPDIQTVISRKDRWLGTSDHQYHKVVATLTAGLTSNNLTL